MTERLCRTGSLSHVPERLARIIVEEVGATAYAVDLRDLMDMTGKSRKIVEVRWRIWDRLRMLTSPSTGAPLSYPYIASLWKADHATVHYGVRRYRAGHRPTAYVLFGATALASANVGKRDRGDPDRGGLRVVGGPDHRTC